MCHCLGERAFVREWVDVELPLCASVALWSHKSCRQEDVGARGVSLINTHSFQNLHLTLTHTHTHIHPPHRYKHPPPPPPPQLSFDRILITGTFGSTESSSLSLSLSPLFSSPSPSPSLHSLSVVFICSFSLALLIAFEPAWQSKGEKTQMRAKGAWGGGWVRMLTGISVWVRMGEGEVGRQGRRLWGERRRVREG